LAERWFFALWPDANVRSAMAEVASACAPAGASRIHPLDLHLTLRFLGSISAESVVGMRTAADRLRWGPVPIQIDRLGCFRASKVLWCAPTRPGADLLGLAAALEAAVTDAGLAAETRGFIPHVTLARRVIRCPRVSWPAPLHWIATDLVLAYGRQGQVPRYVQHRRWSLGAEAPSML